MPVRVIDEPIPARPRAAPIAWNAAVNDLLLTQRDERVVFLNDVNTLQYRGDAEGPARPEGALVFCRRRCALCAPIDGRMRRA